MSVLNVFFLLSLHWHLCNVFIRHLLSDYHSLNCLGGHNFLLLCVLVFGSCFHVANFVSIFA